MKRSRGPAQIRNWGASSSVPGGRREKGRPRARALQRRKSFLGWLFGRAAESRAHRAGYADAAHHRAAALTLRERLGLERSTRTDRRLAYAEKGRIRPGGAPTSAPAAPAGAGRPGRVLGWGVWLAPSETFADYDDAKAALQSYRSKSFRILRGTDGSWEIHGRPAETFLSEDAALDAAVEYRTDEARVAVVYPDPADVGVITTL